MPSRKKMPRTIERSSPKAQRTWRKTHDSAVESYGEGARAHRTAYAALKHSFAKKGDHWEAKRKRGPSDEQAARGGRAARERPGRTAGGVDVAGSTKTELYARARKAGVRGRSRMSKQELARAVARREG